MAFSAEAREEGKTRKDWNDKEWGTPPMEMEEYKGMGFRTMMPKYLAKKVEETGVVERMRAHIESPENKLNPRVVFNMIADRDKPIADDIKRVREIFLKGTKPEDFDGIDEAVKALAGEENVGRAYGKINAENRPAPPPA